MRVLSRLQEDKGLSRRSGEFSQYDEKCSSSDLKVSYPTCVTVRIAPAYIYWIGRPVWFWELDFALNRRPLRTKELTPTNPPPTAPPGVSAPSLTTSSSSITQGAAMVSRQLGSRRVRKAVFQPARKCLLNPGRFTPSSGLKSEIVSYPIATGLSFTESNSNVSAPAPPSRVSAPH